jgi:hypothetical protein
MKALKMVLIACSLSAAVAHAQTSAPADVNAQQIDQAATAPAAPASAQRPTSKPAKKTDDCVGPISYCTLFFGS